MTADELRTKYLEFFKSKGHTIIPSASLIPENDPTVLFTTAGMHPLVPYLMGEKHPAGVRLCDAQKCIRTSDIDEVGDNRHLTFFEMLGNWSFGDYFKKEAIEWSWKFLTGKEWLDLDPQRLYVTVFAGDEKAEEDKDSIKFWQEQFAKAGITAKVCKFDSPVYGTADYRIFALPAKDNWWGPAGVTGPCGPCTEMFYDVAPENGALQKTFDEEMEAGRLMEIWNNVFMEFNKVADGKFEKLAQKNVDTGMGLERTLKVINNSKDIFQVEDTFAPIIREIEGLSQKKYSWSEETLNFNKLFSFIPNVEENSYVSMDREMRIIADHIKAATFILGDDKGLTPSNVGAGYVLRRLIRRAVRYGKQLGINEIFTFKIAEEVVKIYQDTYTELKKNKKFIINQLVKEEEKFCQMLRTETREGSEFYNLKREFLKLLSMKVGGGKTIPGSSKIPEIKYLDIPEITGKNLFDVVTTRGIPLDICLDEFFDAAYALHGVYFKNRDSFDTATAFFKERIIKEFNEEMKKHQELSRTASAGMFKGGLADSSEATIKYHTAAHLMLAALRQVLGEGVAQKGSNITPERLRFDFAHSEKMTPEQIKQVEDIVNEQIQKDLPVVCEEISLGEAKTKGAMGVFESKYGERVKVYSISEKNYREPFSVEICGGPHIERTGVLGKFKITKEESSSAGVRRIKAILE